VKFACKELCYWDCLIKDKLEFDFVVVVFQVISIY